MELLIKNLTKTYSNKVKALDDVSLKIGVGMFGLLGPNGAGKSTLMRTIATIQSPDSGEIHFNDIDVLVDQLSLRKVLGYLPQSFGVYPKMSAEQLLNYFAVLKGVSNKAERKKLVNELLEITKSELIQFIVRSINVKSHQYLIALNPLFFPEFLV